MSRVLQNFPLLFQRFPIAPGNSVRHERDMEHEFYRLRFEDLQDACASVAIFDAVSNLAQLRAGGLVIGSNAFFLAKQEQLAALAVHHGVPAIFENRQFVTAGGLMSYGGGLTDA